MSASSDAPTPPPRALRVAEPVLDDTDRQAVADAVASGWVSGYGPLVARFEETFASWCGARHGIATCNGTTALHLALAAAGVGPGDEVIVPAFTMIAVYDAVRLAGATPVLADSDPDTWNLDVGAARAAVTPRTRALVAVHTYGLPCDMAGLSAVARSAGAVLVEDAAEAHGAAVGGRRAGALADVASFSFFSNKLITTGEGGMVVTSDDGIADRARRLRDLAKIPGGRAYAHTGLGFNYRMPATCAALGLSQMRRIDAFLARRRRSADRYHERLRDVPGIGLRARGADPSGSDWMTPVLVREPYHEGRDALAARLARQGIETRPAFLPFHQQPFWPEPGRFPVAERLGAQGLVLPSGNDLTDADVDRVAARIATGSDD